jgi:hypothetical protein
MTDFASVSFVANAPGLGITTPPLLDPEGSQALPTPLTDDIVRVPLVLAVGLSDLVIHILGWFVDADFTQQGFHIHPPHAQ